MLSTFKLILRRNQLFHDVLHAVRLISSSDYRKQQSALHAQLKDWRERTGGLMEQPLGDGSAGSAVFFGWSRFEYVLAESVVRKAFERADYQVHVLAEPNPANRAVYDALGANGLASFQRFCPLPNLSEAARVLDGHDGFKALIEYEFQGVTVGKYVCSTLMRRTRQGSIDVKDAALRQELIDGLSVSIAAVRGAQNMIKRLDAKVVVLVDRGYSPYGEVFDVCVNAEVQVVTWNVAHRDNTIMLKRYNQSNRLEHPSSLSEVSWKRLCDMPWEAGDGDVPVPEDRLRRELSDAYASGQWYSEVGTQFGKKAWDREQIIGELGLDPKRRTAVVYAHIFWDATFFWGVDLFRDYEDWFVQTVRAACANDQLNWLIKVHPANLVKDRRDGVTTDPSEVIALREQIGELPEHVKVIPADANLTTLSLFQSTNYCITVRGTVGIEAALLGKTVLTAGTGRYDRHGFTQDFGSADSYLKALSTLHNIGDPDPAMREKAARFGYGIFLCRPVSLEVFDLRFKQDATATLQADLKARDIETLREASELVTIAHWLHSGDDDLLNCPDSGTSEH